MDIEITDFDDKTAPDGHPVVVYTAVINGEDRKVAQLGIDWFDATTGVIISGQDAAFLVAINSWRARSAVATGG